MAKIRVGHVITRLSRGGAMENTLHTVRLAHPERYEAGLITGTVGKNEIAMEDQAAKAGVSLIRIPELVRHPAPWNDWRAYRALVRLFREKRYHIVHTHTSKAGFLGRMAAAKAGVPIVVHTPHGHIFDGYFPKPVTWFYTQLERLAARHTDRFIALTHRGIAEHVQQRIGRPDQWLAIFSGIDITPFDQAHELRSPARKALGIQPSDILIGAVGRLEPVKGFTYFVEAAHAVAYAEPRARFLVAGDGSLTKELQQQALPLGDRIRFLGLRDDVPALMAAMDIFVLPSVNEGMGRVVLEAGAAGVPVVAARVGGVPDVVADGVTGLLTPPRDAAALARAIVELARDPKRRAAMGAAGRDFVVPAYSIETMVKEIEALYERLVSDHALDP